MKKSIVILAILVMAFKFSDSQTNVYHPFPDSNAVWTEQAAGCCASECPGPPSPNPVLDDYSFSYFTQNDTVIGNHAYHKIYQTGTVHSHCLFGNYVDNWSTISKTYSGAYRQAIPLKQVFFIYPSSGQECLLFDFKLNQGDTLKSGCQDGTIIVSSVDSVLVGNTYRTRFNITDSPFAIIEGIGSTGGLLEPLFLFEYSGILLCFIQNTQTIYPDTTTVCEIVTQVNEQKKPLAFSISPNPFITQASINSNSILSNATLIIYNAMGQQVKQLKNITGKTITLRRDNLSAGLYFIRLTQDGITLSTDKILITDY